MKKGFTILAALAIIAFIGFAFTPESNKTEEKTNSTAVSENGITFFKGTWEEALAKSKKENKLIFLDAYASWCGPCKMLSRSVFTKANVGEFFNANFINYKMDMEKHKDGPRLARKYGLRAYPTLYFIDGNENLNNLSVGYVNDKQLIEFANKAVQK